MKKLFVYLAAIGCITALSACGSGNPAKYTPPDGKLDKCSLRFSWWGGDDRHEATLAAIKLWEKKHPDITIIPEYGGWDGWTEKVSSQISGGTAPDVMQVNYDWLVSLSPDGDGFYDLGLLADRLDLSVFDDEVLSFGRMNGKLNAVTVSVSGRGLFYNSETFRKCGVSYPETWSELLAVGEKMSAQDCYPLDLDIQSGGTAWYLAVVFVQQQTGRQFVTMDGELGFTEDDIRAALDFYKELEDCGVTRTVRERANEDGNAALYQSPSFIDGTVGGVLEWGSSVGKYDMVLPEGTLTAGGFLHGDNGESGGWMIKPSVLYAISKDTEYPDEAAAFMDFMLSDPECAAVLGTTRGIPASQRAEKALEAGGLLGGIAYDSDDLLEKLDTVTISPYMELPAVKELCNNAIEKVSYGKADTAQAAKELYTSAEEYLRKVRK